MRPGPASILAALSLPTLGTAPAGEVPLPARMRDTGGGTQLITASAARTDATSGTVTWWDRRGGRWVRTGSAPARFGARGLVEGTARRQRTNTRPAACRCRGRPYGGSWRGRIPARRPHIAIGTAGGATAISRYRPLRRLPEAGP
ncbi:hypothetical protein [Streptomyces cyslabdanicus]|uniref:hypothetical protein n=1 Tax=Streptomyces cyslabdanicus TaxID=1470456 RepID=UPI0040451620